MLVVNELEFAFYISTHFFSRKLSSLANSPDTLLTRIGTVNIRKCVQKQQNNI